MTQSQSQSQKPKPQRYWQIGLPLLALLVALGLIGFQRLNGPAGVSGRQADACHNRALANLGGPFDLIDQDGKQTNLQSFAGRPALIYFGYTFCPDVCPMTLQVMNQALETVGEKGKNIQPVLISLDPARDTPAALKAYIASNGFPHGLMGLTGTEAQVKAAADAFKVGFRRNNDPSSAASYMIDHTSILYLMGSDGKLATFFADATPPDEMAQCISTLLDKGL